MTGGCAVEGLSPAPPRPAPAPLGAPYDPAGNPEFTTNDGIDIINAESAYLRGATGAGVTVAVIDTGIDVDHPDLAGNISANSYNVVSGTSEVDDEDGHGTKVAGVVVAERNGQGSHGVAYDAQLMAIKAYRCDSEGCFLYISDLAKAVNYATDNLAHVINISAGGDTPPDATLNAAIQRAADAGAYVVAATGNYNGSEPVYPANIAAYPALDGMVVAVAAANDSGSIASFSNDCGAAMNSCLVAPGVSIATTRDGATSATQTTLASGTSFAAPHVSGALALLIQLYPDAYAADPRSITMFMFDGARDVGAVGVDPVYGHGMLDVAGAIGIADAAIAAATVPLSSGRSASLRDSSLASSPAFGNALSNLSVLGDAIAVIRLSDGEHAYRARLDEYVAEARRSHRLDALTRGGDVRSASQPFGERMSVTMAFSGQAEPPSGSTAPGLREFDRDTSVAAATLHGVQLAGALVKATDFRLGIEVAATTQLARDTVVGRAETLFLFAGEAANPVALLAGHGSGISLSRPVGDSTTLGLAFFDGRTIDMLTGDAEGSATTLGQARIGHDFASGGVLLLDFGVLNEATAQLGSQGTGAFSTDAGATSQFMTVGGVVPIGQSVELLGTATVAATEIGAGESGVFAEWDTVWSNAFAMGAVASDVLGSGDRVGILIGQPLRAFAAGATVVVPVALSDDGQVMQRSERVNLAPHGRELDVQLAYDRLLAPGIDLSSRILLQYQPGHDDKANTGLALGLNLLLAF